MSGPNVAGIPVVFDPDMPPGLAVIRRGNPRTLVGTHPLIADAHLFAALKREAGYVVEVVPSGARGGAVYVLGVAA